jgi:hypothetical protein
LTHLKANFETGFSLHFIGSRVVETRRFQAMGQLQAASCIQLVQGPPTEDPNPEPDASKPDPDASPPLAPPADAPRDTTPAPPPGALRFLCEVSVVIVAAAAAFVIALLAVAAQVAFEMAHFDTRGGIQG